MRRYVLGFAFDPSRQLLLLQRKDRPEWQAGRLNGVGGKIEPGESHNSAAAMVREFFEETGIRTERKDWHNFATMESELWEILCFAYYDLQPSYITPAANETELPLWVTVREFRQLPVLSNLRWLIPLALDAGEIHGAPYSVDVRYKSEHP